MGIADPERTWHLIGSDGTPYASTTPGALGGHRTGLIYGRLDCPSALRALNRGGYADKRVFFADEADAITAGYRPCAVCLPDAYALWKQRRADSLSREGIPDGGRL
jgi:hypothetical protein